MELSTTQPWKSPRATRHAGPATGWVEYILWILGCLALGYCAYLWGRAQFDQVQGSWALDRLSQGFEPAAPPVSEGSLVGRIQIPNVELSAMVFEGTSEDTLARGVGHLTNSSLPGKGGNLVLAGHRDTFFRKLQGIRQGDTVTVVAPDGEFHYVVESTAIVAPDATEVLRPGKGATLTLITCYPFRYIGNAPQRFVVRARKAG